MYADDANVTFSAPSIPDLELQINTELKHIDLWLKVSVNENFSTLLDFVFLDFWHEWVLNFTLAKKENQKMLCNPSKMNLF